ncbi:MAG TPA: recombinase family protein [Patescibacteria group bacterium]
MKDSNTHIIDQATIQALSDNEVSRLVDEDLLVDLQKPYKYRAAGYIRVSTLKQAEKGKFSLEQQEKRIAEFISDKEWELTKCYADKGTSGTKIEGRPDFNKLIEDAQQRKFDVLVVWMSDRFGRNTDEMQELRRSFRKLGVQVISTEEEIRIKDPRTFQYQEGGFDKLLEYLVDFKAEQDNRTRVKRLDLGRKGKAEKGRIPCKTPYGYKKIIEYEPNTGKKVTEEDVVEEDKARIIRYIFECYNDLNWGIRKIASQLNLDKVTSPKGKMWGYSTVKYILQNPTYAGMVRWGWRLSKSRDSRTRLMQGHRGILNQGKHTPIISVDVFEKTQARLQIRKKLGGRAVGSKGLLVGIAKCGRCQGGTYVTQYHHWHAYSKSKNKREKYTKTLSYLCSNYSQYGKSGCSARYVMTKAKLETLVIEEIRKLANSKKRRTEKIKQLKESKIQSLDQAETSLLTNLNKIKEREKRQKYAYDNGIGTFEDLLINKKINDAEAKNISKKLAEVRLKRTNEEDIYLKIAKSLNALTDFDEVWEVASFGRKKELLRAILEKVIVFENRIQLVFVTEKSNSILENQL